MACACATLALAALTAPAAWAGEARSPFAAAAAGVSTAATKPATSSGKAGGGAAAKSSAAPTKAATAPTAPKLTSTPKTTTTTTTTATQETSSGINGSLIFALVLGILLLGGIAFVIVRDARSVAPVAEGVTGGTRNPEGRMRKRRAQAKAARIQRKRHRKR